MNLSLICHAQDTSCLCDCLGFQVIPTFLKAYWKNTEADAFVVHQAPQEGLTVKEGLDKIPSENQVGGFSSFFPVYIFHWRTHCSGLKHLQGIRTNKRWRAGRKAYVFMKTSAKAWQKSPEGTCSCICARGVQCHLLFRPSGFANNKKRLLKLLVNTRMSQVFPSCTL